MWGQQRFKHYGDTGWKLHTDDNGRIGQYDDEYDCSPDGPVRIIGEI
jgi:hypothetical protein